jgi:alkyldihydroxyacetonephosphate synthase
MSTETGDLGVEILQAIKATLDPARILNRGKLPPTGPGNA